MSGSAVAPALACALFLATAPAAGGEPAQVVRCGEQTIGIAPAPLDVYRVVRGRLALPARDALLETSVDPDGGPRPHFAKAGIQVRGGGATVELVVPRRWRRRLAVGWGNRDEPPGARIAFRDCSDADGWFAFPGGFWVDAPACVPLVVRVGRRTSRVRIGVGRACP